MGSEGCTFAGTVPCGLGNVGFNSGRCRHGPGCPVGSVAFSDEPASDAGRRGLVLELSVIALRSGELGPGPDGHRVARPVGHGHSIPIRVKTLWDSCAAGLALMSVLNVAVAPNTPAT